MKLSIKRVVLVIVLMVLFHSSFSQTKKETEDWLSFYLSKYYSGEEDMSIRYRIVNNGGHSYTYDSYSYQFVYDKKLVVTKTTYIDVFGGNIEQSSILIDTVDLKSIVNIEKKISNDDFNRDFWISEIIFDFKDPDFNSHYKPIKYSVISYDFISHKNITYDFYRKDYTIISNDKSTSSNDINDRIIKAFKYLIKIDGGNIITDTF